jgi:hypothetical protein
MNTFLEHKDGHKYTWSAREQKSIIDYTITNEIVSVNFRYKSLSQP